MAGPDPLTDARHAYDAAREAIGNYQLPQARAHLDRAKQLLSDAPGHHLELHIRVQLSESWLTSDEEGLEPALAQVEDARKRAAQAGREGLQALAHIQAGVLCARAGHLEDARTHLRHAVPIAGQLPIDDRVRLLINKGTIESQTGNLSQAAADLRLAADLAEGLPEYRFMALHNLGFIQYLLGNLPGALETMLAADQMDVAVDRTVSRLDRARVLMEAGMVDEAAEVLADSVAALRSAGMTEELSDALLDQARCAMLQQDPSTSGAVAAEVAEMAKRRGNERRALAAEGIRIEAELLAGGSPDVLRRATRLAESAEEAGMGSLADRAAALGHLAAPAGAPPPSGLPDRLHPR